MKVHFVCRGNTYRSRLAEAYCNSLQLDGCTVTSSGIEASDNLNGPITTYALRILEAHGLTKFGKEHWTQTTKANLEDSDMVVFMNKDVYDDCVLHIHPKLKKFYVWNIADVETHGIEAAQVEKLTDETFIHVVTRVDDLVRKLKGEI